MARGRLAAGVDGVRVAARRPRRRGDARIVADRRRAPGGASAPRPTPRRDRRPPGDRRVVLRPAAGAFGQALPDAVLRVPPARPSPAARGGATLLAALERR